MQRLKIRSKFCPQKPQQSWSIQIIQGKKEFPPITSQLIPPLILSKLGISSKAISQCSVFRQKFRRRPLLLWIPNLHEYSKCQMEQINNLTESVTQITSLQNANKLAARSTADPANCDNSDSREDDEVNDRWNRVTIHETDHRLYNEIDLAASFLSHQETSSSSVATTGNPEDDPMMA